MWIRDFKFSPTEKQAMSHLILEQLNTADQALRENLHRHDLDPTAREHMERALSHVREAYIATNEIGKARSVQTLVRDLENTELLSPRFGTHTGGEAKSLKFASDLCLSAHPTVSSSTT